MVKFSVKKPLTVFVAVLAVLVLGVVAYLKMTPDLLPNMDFPYVIIVTSDPGASPESIEQSITRPVEQSMATLDKIKTVTSTSQDSVSMVTLEFEDGANMDTISVDIQQKISVLQGSWDDTVSAPYVLKINPSMLPVMVAAVSREDMDVYALSDFVTGELSPKLEGVSGVASISVSGAVTREAHVILDEAKLDALSEKLADAVRTELNKRKLDLQKAKDQVEKGQAQLDEAKEAIAAGAAAKAGAAVDKLYEYLKEARGQIPGPDPDPDPGKPPITVPGKEELEQLKKTLVMQKFDYLPTLSLTGLYQWSAMNNDFKFKNYRWNPYSMIGITLSVPIFSGGSKFYKVKQTKVSIDQLNLQRDDTKRNLQLAVKQYIDNMNTCIKKFDAAQKGVEQAERGYMISQKRYDTGAGTWLEMNDAELALTQARLNFNQSIYDYMVAKADLEKVLGNEQMN